ncbi:MAG TPA: ATP-binding protein [Ramlibacter sp.]|uniref:ATP-binding protein n=1 Tax=Ramlibacter sp. TaxID=1917967 RepID=UPI002BC738FF|nr:ATP-binding protein [Ramlibacter sp.]HVZ44937.1 ATP-binding protein [Ramlibacter sp.]
MLDRTAALLALDHQAPSESSRRGALVVFCLSLGLFAALLPFAKTQARAVALFVPVNQIVLVANELITMVLLLGQWHLARSKAVLLLACSYLFCATMAVVHLLSFPGAFASGGVVGGGAQTTAYLYVFWHTGLAIFGLAYAIARRRDAQTHGTWSQTAVAALLATLVAAAAAAFVAIAQSESLPPLLAGNHYSAGFNGFRYGQWLLMAAAAVAVWKTPRRSTLDLWFAVALCGSFFEIGLVAIFNAGRFDVGFYAGRIYALLASLSVLAMLLVEQARMHLALARARRTIEEESARQEVEARFRLMVDAMPQLAWIARADGWIHWYNRRWYEYTGATAEDMEGWGWQKVHDPAVLASVMERWTRSIATGEPFEMVFPLKGADGRFRDFLTRVVPMRDESGHVTQWFGTNTDVTRQIEIEQALRESDLRKDEFLATLSHELRNPLAPIRTAVELISRAEPLPKLAADAVRILDRQSRHLTRLVDDLLELSRITQGKLNLNVQRISLNTCVRDAVEAVRPAALAAGQRLEMDADSLELFVQGDATRITQCVLNLLTNAVKFTPHGGQSRIAVSHDSRFARVVVADTGVGIPAEHLERIFEKFSQLTPALQRTHGGLGIGLALARALAHMHGGEVRASSPGPGQGSTFELTLPLADVQAPHSTAAPRPTPGEPPIGARRVLVVDDNVDAAALLADSLRHFGHEVREAHDGAQCLQVTREFEPHVILLDLGMPVMNGLEAAQALRRSGNRAFLVAVTGWGQEKDRDTTRASGFDLHLTKPVDLAQVLSILESLDRDARTVEQ